MKKRKQKFTLKKVKKLFLDIWKNVCKFFKTLYGRFMNLPQNVRSIIYVWAVVVFIVVLMIVLTSSNNQFLKQYVTIENEMNASTLDYVKSNELYAVSSNKLKLDLNVLLDYDYLYEDAISDKTCEGFSLVYYDEEKEDYDVDSYINCDKYTTSGYSDYK